MRLAPRATVHLLTLAAWLTGCATTPSTPALGPVSLGAEEVGVSAQDLSQLRLRYTGRIISPDAAVLEKADYEFVANGQVVDRGSAPLGVTLEAGSDTPFDFQAGATYVRTPEELTALNERGGSVLVALRGTLTLRAGSAVRTLPFAASRQVRGPRLPRVKVASVEGARYSDEQVELVLRLGVDNPNPFPLRLDALGWALSVKGRALGQGTTGAHDTVDAAATGVYSVELAVTKQTWGPDVRALIATGTLPYTVTGELSGPGVRVPYSLSGDVKLNVSR